MILPRYKCKRCGYSWVPRTEEIPITCANPDCRSPYWNKERKTKEDGKRMQTPFYRKKMEKKDDTTGNEDCPLHKSSPTG